MGFMDFFRKKKPDSGPDPIKDATLSNLRAGWLLDYDMKTWEVVARHRYDWGYGEITHEWQLKSADETIYLEKESDDEEEWSVSRKISIGRLGQGIIQQIANKGDPPDKIELDGVTYYLEETGGGHFYPDGKGPGQKMISWDYEDDDGERYLAIEQWGEEEFEASLGMCVEEYQFTNILPSAEGGV